MNYKDLHKYATSYMFDNGIRLFRGPGSVWIITDSFGYRMTPRGQFIPCPSVLGNEIVEWMRATEFTNFDAAISALRQRPEAQIHLSSWSQQTPDEPVA